MTNVLFITAHDAGRAASVYGGSTATPNLASFASSAVTFTAAHAVAPTCSPSRTAMMTGLYPHESGMVGLAHLGFPLARPDRHLARRFSEAGYRTLLSGIQHEAMDARDLGYQETLGADPEAVFRAGFEPAPWDEENAAACAAFLDQSHDRPFFLAFGTFEPHRPFPDVPLSENELAVDSPVGLPDSPLVREDAARFRRGLGNMDRQIGRVLAALDASEHRDRTIVVVTTDHGIDFPRYKATPTDAGLGAMLMVRVPGCEPRTCHDLVSLIDLYPTLLHLAGVAAEPGDQTPLPEDSWTARPIHALCPDAADARPRDYVFSETNYHVAYEPTRTVRGARFRLIRRYHDHAQVAPNIGDSPSKDIVLRLAPPIAPQHGRESIHDGDYDPLNTVDVSAGLGADLRDGLRLALEQWMEGTGDPVVSGDVPAPAGAAVAPADAYTSHAADALMGSGESGA